MFLFFDVLLIVLVVNIGRIYIGSWFVLCWFFCGKGVYGEVERGCGWDEGFVGISVIVVGQDVGIVYYVIVKFFIVQYFVFVFIIYNVINNSYYKLYVMIKEEDNVNKLYIVFCI